MSNSSQPSKSKHKHGMSHVLTGNYCPHCAKFDEEKFKEEWRFPFFLVFGFLQRFMLKDYHMCNRDLVLAMIAGEIWVYNMSRALSKGVDIDQQEMNKESSRRQALPKCNAYSLSQSLGIPPQTVRRKVQQLIDMGWAERSEKGELHITSKSEEIFNVSMNAETMRDFISTARGLFQYMNLDINEDHREL